MGHRVLILHHVEPMWQRQVMECSGQTWGMQQKRIVSHIRRARYDQVLLTRFEEWKLDESYHPELAHLIDRVYCYDYGWCKGMPCPSGHELVPGGRHSEMVLVTPWMKKLNDARISIAGVFDGECIDDLETAFRYLQYKFRRIEHLIV